MKFLIVVDMQVDFINGALGSVQAQAIVKNVVDAVVNFDGKIIFTRDTHFEDYLTTQEGTKLPVLHCIKDSQGWQICNELLPYADTIVDKLTFGSKDLPKLLLEYGEIESVTLCGLCTDICVISNAIIIKSFFPEVPVSVIESCCAGVSEKSHQTALDAMRAVQIDII